MAGIITSHNFPKARTKCAIKWFSDMSENEQPEDWKRVYLTEKSSAPYEQSASYSGLGKFSQKGETEIVSWDDGAQGYITNYINLYWSLGFRMSRMAQKYDQNMNILKRLTQSLNISGRETLRYLAWQYFTEAFTVTRGDGKTLCATDHPAEATGGGTNANRPTADCRLTETSLSDARITISRWQTGKGNMLSARTKSIICTPEDRDEVYRLLHSELNPGDATNAKNPIYGLGDFPGGVIVVPYLTANTWFLLTDQEMDGFKHKEVFPLSFEQDKEVPRAVDCYIAYMAGSFGCDSWHAVYGSDGV